MFRGTPFSPRVARHLPPLTAAMQKVLSGMARARTAPLHTLGTAQARAFYEAGANVLEIASPALARIQDLAIPARDGHMLPARLYAPCPPIVAAAAPAALATSAMPAGPSASIAPANAPAGHSAAIAPMLPVLPVLLYFHGGGFTVGSIATHDILCRELARLAGCMVVSLGYRLAPEHRFPTAVHDAWDALQWLHTHARIWGADPQRMAVGGDSAGGTLATVCATLARDARLPLALQMLFYPGCAAHSTSASYQQFGAADGPGGVLDATLAEWFFNGYVQTAADRHDWRFAPLNTPDLEGVAPVWMGLAEIDPLVDECLQYADMLRMAGVPVDLEIYRGVTHEFIKMGRVVAEARLAHSHAAAALQAAFAPPAGNVSRDVDTAVPAMSTTAVHTGLWAELAPLARAVRTAVFIQEQGIADHEEWDAEDACAVHAVAVTVQGHAVATGRLLRHAPGTSRIGRMAVLKEWRGLQLGEGILAALVEVARSRHDHHLVLNAQLSAQGFYARAGFMPQGEPFDEVGIAHIQMVRTL